MTQIRFTDRQIELMRLMEKKSLTAREQPIYSPFAFYMNIGRLDNLGLVKENNNNNETNSNRKLWSLTEKGKKFMVVVKEMEMILDE